MSEDRKRTARNTFYDIDLAQFIDPYKQLAQDYKNLYFIKKQKMKQAYLVTFVGDPNLIFISFDTYKDRSKTRYKAVKYFKNCMHPEFMGNQASLDEKFLETRLTRYPEFDKYADEGRVPIPELFKLGIQIPCHACGKRVFNQKLLNLKQCVIVEGEGNMNGFTKGILLCKDCYNRLCT